MPTPAPYHFKAVIFDLDGTLIDSVQDIADAANTALLQHGHPLHTYDEYRTFIGKGLRNLCERSLPEEHRDTEEVESCLRLLKEHYLNHPVDKTRLYPGIMELLTILKKKGLMLTILSNKDDILTQRIVSSLGIAHLFTVVSGLHEGFPRKPDPTGALWTLDRLTSKAGRSIPPTEVLYCGDSAVDMQTARNAGFVSAACTWGFRPLQELLDCHPDFLVSTAEEIAALF